MYGGAGTLARRRGLASAQLSTLMHGDLDWIVMKCLEKDRQRRYETVQSHPNHGGTSWKP